MDKHKLSFKGLLIWGICALFFMYEFFLRTMMGTYQHPIMQDLDLSSFQFSLISTAVFFLIYGIMQIPVGLIIDSIGLKKSLVIGGLCCTLASLGFAYTHSFAIAVSFRLIMGLGASFGFISLLIAVYDWMPRKHFALFIGLSQFIGTLGPMLSAGPLKVLSEQTHIDWRSIFIGLAIVGAILVLLIVSFVQNNYQKAGNYIILKKPENMITSISRLFSRVQPWYIACFSACTYFTIEYLSENEGISFLVERNVPQTNASYMLTIAWIGYAVGCPLIGFISDKIERRKILMTGCAVVGLLAILLILYLPFEQYLSIAFFLLGLGASGQSIGFVTMAEQFRKQFVAAGLGLNNAMITTLSAINAPSIGLLLDYTKHGTIVTYDEYLVVFRILIIVAIIALITASIFIKETYCKSSVTMTVCK